MEQRRKAVIRLSILLVFGLAVAWLAFGERGLVHLYRMEEQRKEYRKRIQELESRNRELLLEIESLRTDQAYMESVARRELNLLKDNEVQFYFRGEPGGTDPRQGTLSPDGETGPAETGGNGPAAPGADEEPR
jgi:cell division protein FtsB